MDTVLRILFLSIGMEFYRDIFMKYLNLHPADIAQDHRRRWGKQIQSKKGCPS